MRNLVTGKVLPQPTTQAAKPLAPDLAMGSEPGTEPGMGSDLVMVADKEEERGGDSTCCLHPKCFSKHL